MAEEVKAWRSKSGKIFKTEEMANLEDAVIDIHTFCDRNFSGGSYSPSMIASTIIDEAAKLAPLINAMTFHQHEAKKNAVPANRFRGRG